MPPIPIGLTQNEDGQFYVTPPDFHTWHPLFDNNYQIWCYDCERNAMEVFGEYCEGYLSTGGIDKRMPDEHWRFLSEG
jgi:hypothetical protein